MRSNRFSIYSILIVGLFQASCSEESFDGANGIGGFGQDDDTSDVELPGAPPPPPKSCEFLPSEGVESHWNNAFDDGVQNYGETKVDALPITQWTGEPPEPCSDDTDAVTFEGEPYWMRKLQMPSGSWLTLYIPARGFISDVMYFINGTHGHPFKSFDSAYDVLPDDLLAMEKLALRHQMITVHLETSPGYRPFPFTAAQAVEADAFIRSQYFPDRAYRNFVMGPSYGGGASQFLAIHFPWLFRGAIAADVSFDARQEARWAEIHGEVEGLLRQNSVNAIDISSKQDFFTFRQLEILFGLDLVDLLLYDRVSGRHNFDKLRVPLINVNGDEDQVAFQFRDQNIMTIAAMNGKADLLDIHFVPKAWHTEDAVLINYFEENDVVASLIARANLNDVLRPKPAPFQNLSDFGFELSGLGESTEFDVHYQLTDKDVILGSEPSLLTPKWNRMGRIGLGSSFTLVVRDIDSDGKLDLFTDLRDGSVVRLEVEGSDLVERWRTSVEDQLGSSEVFFDEGFLSLFAFHYRGKAARINPLNGAVVKDLSLERRVDRVTPIYGGTTLSGWIANSGLEDIQFAMPLLDALVKFPTRNVMTDFLQAGDTDVIFTSGKGNVVKQDIDGNDLAMSNSLLDTPKQLGKLDSPISYQGKDAAYYVYTTNQIHLLSEELEILKSFTLDLNDSGIALRGRIYEFRVVSSSETNLRFVALGPGTVFHGEVDITADSSVVTSIPQNTSVGGIASVPSGFSGSDDKDGSSFAVAWALALQDGRVRLYSNLFSKVQTLGESWNNAFGTVASGGDLIAVNPTGAWRLNVEDGSIMNEVINSTNFSFGAVETSTNRVIGAPDGADLFDVDGDARKDLAFNLGGKIFLNLTASASFETNPIDSQNPNAWGGSVHYSDVNSDGFVDLIVGAKGGKVLLFQHSGDNAAPYTADPTLESMDLGDQLIALEVGPLCPGGEWCAITGTMVGARGIRTATGQVTALAIRSGVFEIVFQEDVGLGVYGVHAADLDGDGTHEILAGTVSGHLRVYQVSGSPPHSLSLLHQRYLAPVVGAYDSIETFPVLGPGNELLKTFVTVSTAGGIFGFESVPSP